jgi:hypothetical protein
MTTELLYQLQDTFGHLTDVRIMALTIYGEARGESREGKIAVGSVILERVEHRGWDGKTIIDVCLCPYQFSCFLPSDPNYYALKLIAEDWNTKYMRSPVLQECHQIADGLIRGDIHRTPEIVAANCCQYVTASWRKAAPVQSNRWWEKMTMIAAIGNHEFYA